MPAPPPLEVGPTTSCHRLTTRRTRRSTRLYDSGYPDHQMIPLCSALLGGMGLKKTGLGLLLHTPVCRLCSERKRGRSPKKTTPALYSFLPTSHRATIRASTRPSMLMSPVQMIETCGKVSHEARMSLDTLSLLAKPTSPVLIALGFVIPALSRAVRGFRREFC